MALVLPCLHSELRDVALKGIIDQLRGARYLDQVIVSVSRCETRDQFEELLINQLAPRSLEESMEIGWKILGTLDDGELTRLSNEQIARFIRRPGSHG